MPICSSCEVGIKSSFTSLNSTNESLGISQIVDDPFGQSLYGYNRFLLEASANLGTGQLKTKAFSESLSENGTGGGISTYMEDDIFISALDGTDWIDPIEVVLTMQIDGTITGPEALATARLGEFRGGVASIDGRFIARQPGVYSAQIDRTFAVSSDIPFFHFYAELFAATALGDQDSIVDFSNTATLGIVLPDGFGFTSDAFLSTPLDSGEPPVAVSEPGSLWLLGLGLFGLGLNMRRNR